MAKETTDITQVLQDAGLANTAPQQSSGLQWWLANQGNADTYNQNIKNWFTDPTAHTKDETLAAMQQYGISPQDVFNATGKSWDSYYTPTNNTIQPLQTAGLANQTTPKTVYDPTDFYNQIQSGNATAHQATTKGLQMLYDAGYSPDQAAQLWNQAYGTNFTGSDYTRELVNSGIVKADKPQLAVFGDSISSVVGYNPDATADTSSGQNLAQYLGTDLKMTAANNSVGGQTTQNSLTGEGIPYLGKNIPIEYGNFADYITSNKPEVAVLRFGAADAIRLNDPATTLSNIEQMVKLAKENGSMPVLVGVTPFAKQGDFSAGNIASGITDSMIQSADTINAGIQKLADKYGVKFVDVRKVPVPKGALLDGVHPNGEYGAALDRYIADEIKSSGVVKQDNSQNQEARQGGIADAVLPQAIAAASATATPATAPVTATPAATSTNYDALINQILGSSDPTKWQGTGFGSAQANAADMAQILGGAGITDISQLGKVKIQKPDVGWVGGPEDGGYQELGTTHTEEVWGNTVTGQPLPNTYGERQTGDAWGGTYAGSGNTGYRVFTDAQGNNHFYTTGASSNTLANMFQDSPLLASVANIVAATLGGPAGVAALAAAQGKKPEDIIKAAALSYVGGQVANTVTGAAGDALNVDAGSAFGPDNIDVGGGFNPATGSSAFNADALTNTAAKIVGNAAGNVVSSGGKMDFGTALVTGGINAGVNAVVNQIPGYSDLPNPAKTFVNSAVTSVIKNGGNLSAADIERAAIAAGTSALKTGLSDYKTNYPLDAKGVSELTDEEKAAYDAGGIRGLKAYATSQKEASTAATTDAHDEFLKSIGISPETTGKWNSPSNQDILDLVSGVSNTDLSTPDNLVVQGSADKSTGADKTAVDAANLDDFLRSIGIKNTTDLGTSPSNQDILDAIGYQSPDTVDVTDTLEKDTSSNADDISLDAEPGFDNWVDPSTVNVTGKKDVDAQTSEDVDTGAADTTVANDYGTVNVIGNRPSSITDTAPVDTYTPSTDIESILQDILAKDTTPETVITADRPSSITDETTVDDYAPSTDIDSIIQDILAGDNTPETVITADRPVTPVDTFVPSTDIESILQDVLTEDTTPETVITADRPTNIVDTFVPSTDIESILQDLLPEDETPEVVVTDTKPNTVTYDPVVDTFVPSTDIDTILDKVTTPPDEPKKPGPPIVVPPPPTTTTKKAATTPATPAYEMTSRPGYTTGETPLADVELMEDIFGTDIVKPKTSKKSSKTAKASAGGSINDLLNLLRS